MVVKQLTGRGGGYITGGADRSIPFVVEAWIMCDPTLPTPEALVMFEELRVVEIGALQVGVPLQVIYDIKDGRVGHTA
jgi:hypothetical protein